jgi:hypothetical protein
MQAPKDFNRIVEYYMKHYENIIKRLFEENGYEIELKKSEQEQLNEDGHGLPVSMASS